MIKVGDLVCQTNDGRTYTGKVVQLDEKNDSAYVRWHRGYANWVSLDRIKLWSDCNNS